MLVQIQNSEFLNNTADNAARDIYVESVGSNPAYVMIDNSTFAGNSFPTSFQFIQSGTGMLHTTIRNYAAYLPVIMNPLPSNEYAARITNITIDDNWQYVIDFETTNYTPQVPGQHVHFFFDTILPDQAGVPANPGV